MEKYHYTECGLDNVLIEGIRISTDDADDEVLTIPNVRGLHRLLARMVLRHPHGILPKELRFLRTEMGMTQAELAALVKKDHQTVGRWERGETPIEPNAEFVVRMIARERLSIGDDVGAEQMAGWCVPTAPAVTIEIDGRDPDNYKPLLAA